MVPNRPICVIERQLSWKKDSKFSSNIFQAREMNDEQAQ